MAEERKSRSLDVRASISLGGLLGNLVDVVAGLERSAVVGEARDDGPGTRQGVCGVTVRLGSQGPAVQRFGNVRTDEGTGEPFVDEVFEPIADVFAEADHTSVVAEMPGIAAGDVRVEGGAGVLILSAERDGRRYRKEIRLEPPVSLDRMQVTCRNGIVEVRFARGDDAPGGGAPTGADQRR